MRRVNQPMLSKGYGPHRRLARRHVLPHRASANVEATDMRQVKGNLCCIHCLRSLGAESLQANPQREGRNDVAGPISRPVGRSGDARQSIQRDYAGATLARSRQAQAKPAALTAERPATRLAVTSCAAVSRPCRPRLMREHVRLLITQQIELASDRQERKTCLRQGKPVLANQDRLQLRPQRMQIQHI